MFGSPVRSGQRLRLEDVELLVPCEPTKVIGLWNNFQALAEKLGSSRPKEPLYFLKAPSNLIADSSTINRPTTYQGKVIYEGELGIVIGKPCTRVTVAEASAHIFGYTCVNDVTAIDILSSDPSFAQWSRSKSFDDFGPVGPSISTDIDPTGLTVRTTLNGAERQSYPISDMIFSPRELVSLISHDMTLLPGDLICCGTSVGVGSIREATNLVTVAIDGIGELRMTFRSEISA